MSRDRTARVIAITSGKGGVGKTNVGVNLSVTLARMGRQAMLVDGDLGLANANILLGLNSDATIADVIARERRLQEVVLEGPCGMVLVPGHSGGGLSSGRGKAERRRIAEAFRPYAASVDHVIVDTSSGIAPDTLRAVAESDLILLVLSDEPTAFMDAYQMVKALALDHQRREISVVTNMVRDEDAGRQLFHHFDAVVRRFLPVELAHLGSVPRDERVREAVLRKQACVEAYPDSPASAAFARMARALADAPMPPTEGGHRFFAMEAMHGAH